MRRCASRSAAVRWSRRTRRAGECGCSTTGCGCSRRRRPRSTRVCDGRGFEHAAAVLGPDLSGVLVRDGWAAYRGFKNAPHQTCAGHLLRRCADMRAAHPDTPWTAEVQAVLEDGLALRDRCNAGGISEHGLATARGRLVARLGRLIDAAPPLADAERFAKHLANEFPAVFLFLCDPSIDATNWRAEQAIRPAVVTRKVCGGNRTRKGADTRRRWRAWCAPPANAGSTPARCSRRCCAPAHPSCPKRLRCRHPPDRRRAAPDGPPVRRPSHRAGCNRPVRDSRCRGPPGDVPRDAWHPSRGPFPPRASFAARPRPNRRCLAACRPPNSTILRQAHVGAAPTFPGTGPFSVTFHGPKPLPDPVTEYSPG